MGLDMYLTANRYVSSFGEDKGVSDAIRKVFPSAPGDGTKNSGDVIGIDYRIGYWRKANQIHKWFVDNCQDGVDECQKTYVSRAKLQELLEACKAVLEAPEKAPDLIPTEDGFFFGDTEYGEYYFQDLKNTVPILERAIEAAKDGHDIYYQSSW